MRKLPNPRRVKIHRSYTVDELAQCLDIHKNTVRNWIKNGLDTVDNSRPVLLLGSEIRDFITNRKAKNRRKLCPGEIYCVRCRDGKYPAGEFATIELTSKNISNLVGVCPECDAVIYRRISCVRWREAIGDLEVSIPEAWKQLSNGGCPSLDCDFEQGVIGHAKVQP